MKISFRRLPFGCALGLVCLLVANEARGQESLPTPNRVTHAPDNSARISLKGEVHPLARAEFSRGAVADSLPMDRILLLLKRSEEQEDALQSLLEAQQDKSSANYHKWLSPDDFGKQFGPSDSDLQSVTDWLTAQGFHDIHVGPGRNVIEFSGSAGQVRQAFSAQMRNYSVNGTMYVANSSDPQIPAALAPVISGIVSLHNFPRKSHSKVLGEVRKDPVSHKLQPLFTFPDPTGSGLNFYGVGPGDFATIYNAKTLMSGGNDGTGQTIAIVGETQIDPTDVNDFRTMFGLSNNFSASNVILNGMDPGITSKDEESESDLDVQWSGATAPGATIKFVVSASTPASAGIDLSALYIIEHNLADVLSESYGACESDLGSAGNAFYNSLWEQAAAQGITVVVSSGDGGSAGCDDFNSSATASQGLAVSGIAGTPYNVSVGGTDFNQINTWSTYWSATNDSATGTSAKGYIPETPWSENCAQLGLTGCGATAPDGLVNIVAASGGPSKVYAKPKWQMGVTGVPNDNHRDQPDISLFASPGFTFSAYLYCQKDLSFVSSCNLNNPFYTFQAIGGTSASAPAFAGVMALVNQYAAAHGGSPRQGNPNPILYALAKKSGASCTSSATEAAGCIFNDVTSGNSYLASHFGKSVGTNSVPCKGGTPNCSATVATTTGVLVDPSHTSTEAWTAAAGYDMATGLGSLNINNLATNWGSASTIGTTTTLSLSPTTGITHGANENVTVTVNVTPKSGSGVPSGDASLIATLSDGSTLGLDQFTLSNGSISGVKTQSLPGGTYKVYAHYAGDGTNAPSDSPQVQVTVGKESSQTFIVIPTQTSGNATSLVYGSPYIIRMYVANSAAVASTTGPPSPTCETTNAVTCPTGTVTLTANGSPLDGGVYSLNNIGYTRDIAPTLTGGTYSLVAKYSGDSSYTASTSATGTLTITPAPGVLAFTNNPIPLVGVPLTMYVSGGPDLTNGVTPTGTLSIFDGSTLIGGPVAITPNPVSSSYPSDFTGAIQLSYATGGDHQITVKYGGDANYTASSSSPLTVHPLYVANMTVTPSATNVNYGQSVTITATIKTNTKNPPITGTFRFGFETPITVAGTPGTDASGNQTLTASASMTPQGNTVAQVNYSGDSNFEAALGDTSLISVNIPDFSLGPANNIAVVAIAGQPGSTQLTITPATQTPSTVNLSFYPPNPIAGYTFSLNPQQASLNGSATAVALSLTPIGSAPQATIRRNQRRSGLLDVSRGARNNWWLLSLVTGFAALILVSPPGRERRCRVAIALSTACVLFLAMGCGGGGSASGGGGGGGGNSSPTPTSISLSTSNAKVDQNTQFIITVQVVGQHPLTGNVTVYDYGQAVWSIDSLTNGQAQFSGGFGGIFGIGVHQFTAKYNGDSQNLTSTSSAVAQAITGTNQVFITGSTGADSHMITANLVIQ